MSCRSWSRIYVDNYYRGADFQGVVVIICFSTIQGGGVMIFLNALLGGGGWVITIFDYHAFNEFHILHFTIMIGGDMIDGVGLTNSAKKCYLRHVVTE